MLSTRTQRPSALGGATWTVSSCAGLATEEKLNSKPCWNSCFPSRIWLWRRGELFLQRPDPDRHFKREALGRQGPQQTVLCMTTAT